MSAASLADKHCQFGKLTLKVSAKIVVDRARFVVQSGASRVGTVSSSGDCSARMLFIFSASVLQVVQFVGVRTGLTVSGGSA